MNLKILTCCDVMYRFMRIIGARFILQNNLAGREAVFVHPRLQVLLVLLAGPSDDGGTAGDQGVGIGGGTEAAPPPAPAVLDGEERGQRRRRGVANRRGEEARVGNEETREFHRAS